MSLLRQFRVKQKRDAEEAAQKRADRIAKRVARAAAKADGLADLPLEVALAMELNPAQPTEPEPVQADDSVTNLVARLMAIRKRIWMLQAVFAVSLIQETAIEANRYLQIFQELAALLREKDPSALESLTLGHESLLLAPALPIKQSIPLSTQRLCEMRWQAMTQPTQRAPKRPTVSDGLDWLVS